MDQVRQSRLDDRILIFTPTGRDAELTRNFLEDEGLLGVVCQDATALHACIGEGAGACILAEEALTPNFLQKLLDLLGRQPGWSDLPLIVFVRDGDTIEPILETIGTRANITILERPVRVRTLVSAARAALRARARQYHTRELLTRLAEADRRKDEFLAVLGHELRTPLAAIRTANAVLDTLGDPSARAARQRAIIQRQAQNLAHMIEDLLDIARITAGKIVLRRSRVDLNDIAEQARQSYEPAATARRHTLQVSRAPYPVIVEADPVRLEQIIGNLIQNAIKYTPEGGRISVWVGREFGRASLRVVDTGLGLAPEMLPRIFEPFVQVSSSLQYSQGGLGLGLPLVRRLVELHGGEIQAASDGPGRGSVFTITLPSAASQEAQTPAVRPETRPAPPERLRVLLVDDNDDLREAMRELLVAWGHDVEEAATGGAALQKAQERSLDVALIDLGLPDVDGIEVARRLRALPITQGLRLVALTGYGQSDDRRRTHEAGFDLHLVKPVDQNELAEVLNGPPVH
jgi:signal transduction histidine kinase/CheY-like chemotaxis protein